MKPLPLSHSNPLSKRCFFLPIASLLLMKLICPPLWADDSHAVYDLFANRFLGHVELRSGLLIPAGSPGFAKYVHLGRKGGWKFVVSVDQLKVALAGTSAPLLVPLTSKQAEQQQVLVHLKVNTPSSIKVHVGSKVSKPVALKPGWQVVVVPLPEKSLHEGENNLWFEFGQKSTFFTERHGSLGAAAAVRSIQVGGTAPKPEITSLDAGFPSEILRQDTSLIVPGGGALYYYVSTAQLSLRVQGQGRGCSLSLSLSSSQTDSSKRWDVPLSGVSIPLFDKIQAGRDNIGVARLGLHAQGQCSSLLLSQAELVIPGKAPSVQRPSKPTNVILWLTDNTRADKFKLWNPASRVETPVFDAFSKQATRFELTYSQGNESRVSHASLFTGLYPKQHNFISGQAILSGKWTILPEVAKQAGLYTIGHTANGYINKRWGFGDGWDSFKNHIHEGRGLKGEDLVRDVREFLKKGAGKTKPFFFYIGSIDAHVSWRAHEPWLSKYDNTPYHGPLTKAFTDPQLNQVARGKMTLSERDKIRAIALYDSNISYTDQQFGELLTLLKETGHDRDTMIIVTSDHGEEFWEHGKIGHSQSLHPELIHVPLWVYYPPLFPAGKVVSEGAELIDILPTLSDALGLQAPKESQGESLIPISQGVSQGYPRPTIASQYELAYAIGLGPYKMWVGGGGDIKVFDARTDSKEQKDLSAQSPVVTRFMLDPMSFFTAYQSFWKKSRFGAFSNHLPAFGTEMEKADIPLAFGPSPGKN